MQTNALYYGDCLDWMEQWDDQSVDLIYLDPPFNSKATYNQLYHKDGAGDAQFRAFNDTWVWDESAQRRWLKYKNAPGLKAHDGICGFHQILGKCGMLAYLTYMAERLEHMHRLLKDTGSIYLHCDPTASHYLKAIMDAIFTKKWGGAFRNEIVWCYKSGGASPKTRFSKKHDVILYYAKSAKKCFYNPQFEKSYNRGLKPYRFKGVKEYSDEIGWYTLVGMKDYWLIDMVGRSSSERLGYPTQKPIKLLERIVKASSNEGDIVLDPFCGCGTTVEAARNLNRQFVGIDISSFAIDLVRERRLKDHSIPVYGIPYDLKSAEKLAKEKPFDFESWAITRMPGFVPNTKQVADGGVDGRGKLADKPVNHKSKLALAQVKGGQFSLSGLRDFTHVINRDNAALGRYVTLKPVSSSNARMESLSSGQIQVGASSYPRMLIWSIEEYFDNRLPQLPTMSDPYTGKAMLPQLFTL